jgi:hypothetical protein
MIRYRTCEAGGNVRRVKRRRQGRGEDPFHDTSVMQGYAAWSFDVVQQLDYKVESFCWLVSHAGVDTPHQSATSNSLGRLSCRQSLTSMERSMSHQIRQTNALIVQFVVNLMYNMFLSYH